MTSAPTILLLAGEASGDDHAAALSVAVRKRLPGARLIGLGGPLMAAAGVELLEQILADDEGFEPVYKALGECYELDRNGEALTSLGQRFIALQPSSATGHHLKGMGHFRLATDSGTSMLPAIEALQRAIELEPGVSDRHFTLAKALEWEKKHDQAIAELKEAIRLDPKHDSAHYVLATLYRRTGSRDLAAEELKIHQSLPERAPRGIRLLVETQPR